MDIEGENPRLRMVSDLLIDFNGPLPDSSHCHICLDSWYTTDGEDDITCKSPVIINHHACQCRGIVMGRECLTSWLLEKDTCPMCRADLIGAHLRNRPPPLDYENEDSAENEEDEYTEEDGLEEESWLHNGGNYIHSTRLSSGEDIEASQVVELFLNKRTIEEFKTENERMELFTSLGTHSATVWEKAYQELVSGRQQVAQDLFTIHGPVVVEGIPLGDD